MSLLTDDNGAFRILRLPDGTYNLTVDAGSEYQPATESVQIIDNGAKGMPGQTVAVQIHLQYREHSVSQPGVIDAGLSSITKPAQDLYEQALAASQAGDHKKSISQLKQAIALAPEFVLALNELGMQYLRINELEHAAESLRTAIKYAPNLFIPRMNYGLVLLQQKQFAKAEAQLSQALEKNDQSAPAHEYHGRALIGLQRLDEAEKELLRAVALGGDQAANAHRYLGALYMQRGDDVKARKELEEYLRLQPNVKDAEQIKQIIKDLSKQN